MTKTTKAPALSVQRDITAPSDTVLATYAWGVETPVNIGLRNLQGAVFTADAIGLSTAQTETGDFIAELRDFKGVHFSGITPSMTKLLSYIQTLWQAGGRKGREVNLSRTEYMKLRGITDLRYLNEAITEDLRGLRAIEAILHRPATKMKRKRPALHIRLIDAYDENFDGDNLKIFLSASFLELMYRLGTTPYALEVLGTNDKDFPHANNMYWAFRDQTRFNPEAKKTNRRLTVLTLLSKCGFPTEAEVKAGGRNYRQRIITPFEKTLDHMQDRNLIKSWRYLHSDGTPLTDEETFNLPKLPFKTFKTYMVEIEWPDNEPDTEELIKGRNKGRRTANRKKKQKETANATTKTPGFKRTEVIDILAQDSPADQEEGG